MSNVAFSQWQPIYAEHGVATIPCADQSKRPLVKHPQKFGCRGSTEIASKFPDARTFGFYTGEHSGITLCDVDDTNERIFADALDRHGPTPIHIRSGSGKFHALYRYNGERRCIRPWGKELKIDILGATGLCIAPPSMGAKGQYQIIQGSLDDLDRLPIMRGLEDRLYHSDHAGPRPQPRSDWSAMREHDGRNDQLWRQLMDEANNCDTYEKLLDRARTLNEGFGEPMEAAEVIRCTASAWKKAARGENWCGRGRSRQAEVDRLVGDPYVLSLLDWLKVHHGPDNTFMIADGLADVLGWPRRRLPAARRSLIAMGYLTVVRAAHSQHVPRSDWSAMREHDGRNDQLWRQLMDEANNCDTYEKLLDRARTLNEGFGEPMEAAATP